MWWWPKAGFCKNISWAVFFRLGVEVFCAETVINPMQLYPQDNVNVLPPADEIKFLLTLRFVRLKSAVTDETIKYVYSF